MQLRFLLQILLLTQHISGTTMPMYNTLELLMMCIVVSETC